MHKKLAKFCSRDRTYGECITELLNEFHIQKIIAENLPEMIAKSEEGKRTGKSTLSIKAADMGISTLTKIKAYLVGRNPSAESELFLLGENAQKLEEFFNRMIELNKVADKLDMETYIQKHKAITNDLAKLLKRNVPSPFEGNNNVRQ